MRRISSRCYGRLLKNKYGKALYTAGYKIYSTLDFRMQQIAEEAVKSGLSSIEKRDRQGVEAALIAVDARTGHIKAMVGGSNFWRNQFNRATQALRQPGSAFKPFVYMTAIEEGMTCRRLDQRFPGIVSRRQGRTAMESP